MLQDPFEIVFNIPWIGRKSKQPHRWRCNPSPGPATSSAWGWKGQKQWRRHRQQPIRRM